MLHTRTTREHVVIVLEGALLAGILRRAAALLLLVLQGGSLRATLADLASAPSYFRFAQALASMCRSQPLRWVHGHENFAELDVGVHSRGCDG